MVDCRTLACTDGIRQTRFDVFTEVDWLTTLLSSTPGRRTLSYASFGSGARGPTTMKAEDLLSMIH